MILRAAELFSLAAGIEKPRPGEQSTFFFPLFLSLLRLSAFRVRPGVEPRWICGADELVLRIAARLAP